MSARRQQEALQARLVGKGLMGADVAQPDRTPVSAPLEDYGLIGDLQSAALVRRNGSIDWLCLPRFDSPALFAALLGDARNGRWVIEPQGAIRETRRRYRHETLILETDFETAGGAARVIDFMPPRGRDPDLVRIVAGLDGRMAMRSELVVRFDYGSRAPWIRRGDTDLTAVAGPDALVVRTPAALGDRNGTTISEFEVAKGERLAFTVTWYESHRDPPVPIDPHLALEQTERFWHEWVRDCAYDGEWRDAVIRSLIVLKALTYAPTGGVVAAPTTSLPERLGGVRNWDYRYCWLRDATLTLLTLLDAGYTDEARAWRDWLIRAVGGDKERLQVVYGPHGERRLTEQTLEWLPGYEGSRPVRIGNAACEQRQLDVYGEVIDMLHQARVAGLDPDPTAWELQRELIGQVERFWQEPDEGIWEVRGPRRHFTQSKVMAWVAVDRAVKAVERFGLDGPLVRWKQLRSDIRDDVMRHGIDSKRGLFVQAYGSDELDGALLLLPLVGFVAADDARMLETVAAIQAELCRDGFVMRYATREELDGLPEGEGAFLPCSFWLMDNLVLQGRQHEARALFQRLLNCANDLGLLAEEYAPEAGRQLGNFPQAFTHLALVNSAFNISPEVTSISLQRRA